MLDNAAADVVDPRASARSNVFLSATLLAAGNPLPVRVRNISSNGALVDGRDLPSEGSIIKLRRGSLNVDGEIAWINAGQCGLRFNTNVDVEAWIKRVGHTGQQRVDRIVTLIQRSPFPDAASLVLASSEDSLDAISVELTAICECLASSPGMVAGHSDDLLRLDAIAQRLRQAVGAKKR